MAFPGAMLALNPSFPRRKFNSERSTRFFDKPTDASLRGHHQQIAHTEGVPFAVCGLQVRDGAFQLKFIFGDSSVPVKASMIARFIITYPNLKPRISEKGMGARTRQITGEKNVLKFTGKRAVLGGTDGIYASLRVSFHQSVIHLPPLRGRTGGFSSSPLSP
jgi:hypothetical protein